MFGRAAPGRLIRSWLQNINHQTVEVDNAERAADRVTHEVNRLIHKTFITPIDRDQIHSA
jgi:uncharacterized protein Yka (UPF0111/DUF47 family)